MHKHMSFNSKYIFVQANELGGIFHFLELGDIHINTH